MDIFSRIDNQSEEQTDTVAGIIEKDGKYGYKFVLDISKFDANYDVLVVRTKFLKEGFFAEKRAEKLYKFLLKPLKKCKNQKEFDKEKAKRTKKIETILRKGINFDKYFSTGMKTSILVNLPEDEIKMLYEFGLDYESAISQAVNAEIVVCKKIYFGVTEFDCYTLRHIASPMLEKLIHTRGDLKLSQKIADSLIDSHWGYTSARSVKNIQILIKTGQIYLSAEQILKFCNTVENHGGVLIPELQTLKQYAETKIPPKEEVANKKVSKQRHLVRKCDQEKAKPETKSAAQQAIDKLFEDAQKASE